MSLRTFINSVRLLLDQGVYTARNAIRAEDESSSHHLDVTQLEERVLMSASPLAVVAEPPEAAAATAATTELAAITTVPANDGLQLDDQQLLDVVGDAVLPQPSVDGDDSRLLPDASEHTLELVFVDGSVNDLDQMVENLQSANTSDENSTLEIIILESQTDGMGQISSTMRNYRDIDAIHVVSHGSDGQVRLGSTTLSLDNLDDYRSSIGAWQDSMSSEADLLFYGCNLAATADGQELMNQISAEWDVDVAASDDLTGHSDFGGDWDLEYQTGDVETQIAFSTDLQENWYNVLAIAVDNSSDGGMSSGSTTTVSHTTSGDNRLMLVGVATDPHGESVASITYNGFNLSLVGAEEDSGSHSRAEIWSLVAPDTGSHDVVVTMTGNGHHGVVVGVMTFTGVDQTTPLENFSAASGASNTASTTVTSTSDDLVFGVVHSHHGSSSAAGAGQTEYWDRTEWVSNGSGTVEAGAASVTTSWTVTNDDWTVAAVSIRSASAPPVITNIETVDQDADGQIDQIRITTSETLNDNFGDLSIAVWGYEINTGVGTNGYTTGATANDNIFYVNLVESGTPDTGATPNVSVVQNTLLTEDGGTDALAADAGHIVFERNSNIYTADPDGSNETLVLDDPGGLNNFAPVFSPDRSKIFFYSDRDGTNNQWDIWSMDADGSNLTQLTTGSDNDRFATLSPDGTKILWERQVGGDRQIWIMDSDGSNQQVLINSGSNDRQPAWSPDGSQIVFRSDRDGNDNIYVADADGSNQTPLTSSTDNERGPRWSPDGTQILYTRDVGGDNQVWIMDADGGNQTMIVDSLGEDENPSWSPDGSRIIFISTRDGNNEIYTADPDGMNQARETNNGVDENRPRWASAWTVAATDDADPVATITRDDADPTSADTVNFSVDFSEDVSNVTAADFTVVTTGTVTANMTVTVTQVTASTYTITIDTIAGDGTVSLDFNGATDIVDGVGNAINTIPSTDEVYTIDQPPVITARETVDSDGDGQIDQIRITTSEALNDNFGDLVIRVNGIEYSAADMDTGATALDNVFNVNLTPSGTPDTDATPYVAIVANTMLADGGAAPDALSPDGGPGWWDVYWQNRQQITLDWSAHPGADRIDFPVRIQLDSGDVDFSKIKAGGADIRFRDADGSELSYEIETWDDVGETATIWVKVPVLDTSSSQIIHLYYNNPTAIDDQDLDGTWAANFAGVYHLDESGTAANGFQDSSGNGVHGQGGDGNPIFAPIEVSPGHSGDHQLFDGANDHVNFASRDFGNQFTIEAWIKPDNTPNAIQGIVANSATGFSTQGFRFFIRGDDGTIRLETRGPSSGSAVVQTAASQVNFGVWNHVAVTVDRTAGTATIYHNGVNVATGAVKTDFPTNSDWEIGGFEDRVISFDGEIDEVRVSSTARDASHILASYMSQLDDSLNTFGVEEEVGVVATDAAAPVLISATTPQSDGSNLFQAEGQTLDLVFSEALGASISEVNLEIALLFGGGASDGDNLPTLGTGANPIAFTTTNVANDTLRVTFNTNNVANADWLRVGTHTVQIADGSNLDDAVGNDGNTAGAAVTITGVANTAPVLDNTGDMTLTDVAEDDTNPPGNTVQAIIDSAAGDRVTDVDFFSVEGIAVTDVDDTDGTWQYNTGSGWTIFGSVTDNAAVLLNDAALIRFVPNGNYNGSAGDITFRAWDRTSGVNGQIGVDVSANGGSTAFSIATETATLDVSSINDEPTISAIPDQTLLEDTATGAIAFTISDVETAAGALTLTATSSDQALVPDGNITLGGSGSNRT
ncbi:MAG: DUF2341 domain-containing protein, partial [Fuerstiella sp.]|nr:DUF2341 domain-containing protein [Fuerstiella sp.]